MLKTEFCSCYGKPARQAGWRRRLRLLSLNRGEKRKQMDAEQGKNEWPCGMH